MNCIICETPTIQCEVKVVHKGQVVGTTSSYLAAEKLARDLGYTSVKINHVYTCTKCQHSEVMASREYVDETKLWKI